MVAITSMPSSPLFSNMFFKSLHVQNHAATSASNLNHKFLFLLIVRSLVESIELADLSKYGPQGFIATFMAVLQMFD